jgi:hypothetical protein
VTALGAWLYHVGGATRKIAAAAGGTDAELALANRYNEQVAAAWEVFRRKWDPSLPDNFKDVKREQLARLVAAPPASAFDLYQPPLAPDPAVWETR